MTEQAPPVFTARDLENARVLGTLAGEVRVLKWGTGLALAAILGALGLLYQNQIVLQERVVQVEERVVRVEERVVRVEERVVHVEKRLDGIDRQLATISSHLATLISLHE